MEQGDGHCTTSGTPGVLGHLRVHQGPPRSHDYLRLHPMPLWFPGASPIHQLRPRMGRWLRPRIVDHHVRCRILWNDAKRGQERRILDPRSSSTCTTASMFHPCTIFSFRVYIHLSRGLPAYHAGLRLGLLVVHKLNPRFCLTGKSGI